MDNKDDRIVDFNELKNKAREKDIDKFEQYIYSLYYSFTQGEMNMADFSTKINEYMQENNISYEKLFNIQKEMMKRYGFNIEDLETEMKNFGIEVSPKKLDENYETMKKALGFQEKYKDRISSKLMTSYTIKNSLNNLEVLLQDENVILKSTGKVNLQDNELNEFLYSYKKLLEDKNLNISIFEDVKTYEY